MQFVRIQLETIDSTNTYAKQHADTFDPGKITCITTEEQTAGRGRFNKIWQSPKEVNLYVTFFFHLPLGTKHLPCLAHIGIHSLAQTLIEAKLSPKIKWPNDILLSGKKLAGVLCEITTTQKSVEVVLGIGLNVNMRQEQLDEIDQIATSLLVETKRIWDKERLLAGLQKHLASDLERFKKWGFEPFQPFFNDHLAYKGETIRVKEGNQQWSGLCEMITPNGELRLRLSENKYHDCLSGEVAKFRPQHPFQDESSP